MYVDPNQTAYFPGTPSAFAFGGTLTLVGLPDSGSPALNPYANGVAMEEHGTSVYGPTSPNIYVVTMTPSAANVLGVTGNYKSDSNEIDGGISGMNCSAGYQVSFTVYPQS